MGNLNPAILIITLNVNGLNTPIKEQSIRLDCFKKQDKIICYLQEMNFKYKITESLKVNYGKRYTILTLITGRLEWLN